jgi:hypothetical protein
MAKSDIRVKLSSALPEYAYGEPLMLEYSVENRSRKARFVATKTFLAEVKTSSELHLLIGEMQPPRGLYYFDYEAPELVRLRPRSKRTFRVTVGMPLLETAIDANGNAYDAEVSVAGAVTLVLRVGFLDAAFRAHSANPWGEFVTAQELSAPAKTRLRIERRA